MKTDGSSLDVEYQRALAAAGFRTDYQENPLDEEKQIATHAPLTQDAWSRLLSAGFHFAGRE